MEQATEILARIQTSDKLDSLIGADLIVEAIVEKLEVKQSVFSQLESICSDNTIFTSNTSSISITSIGAVLQKPERLAGLHFFNPAPVMKLVEVIYGLSTSRSVIDTLLKLTRKWGKSGVAAKSSPGFIVNRVARPFYAEGLRLLEEGVAEPAMIDALLREAGGFRMGPFELTDLIGQDVNYLVTCSVFEAYYNDPRFKPSLVQKELVDGGWLGRKSGRGFYKYIEEKIVKPELIWDGNIAGDTFQVREIINAPVISRLVERIKGSNVTITSLVDGKHGEIRFSKGARLMLTNGKTTLERCKIFDDPFVVQMDLALDYGVCSSLAISAHPEISIEVLAEVYAFFDFLDIKSIRVKDLPGLIVMRTVSMLVNEASDALHFGVSDVQGIDTAMCSGVNYPLGLFQWTDNIGSEVIVEVLNNLIHFYGEDRYRISPALQIQHMQKQPFYSK